MQQMCNAQSRDGSPQCRASCCKRDADSPNPSLHDREYAARYCPAIRVCQAPLASRTNLKFYQSKFLCFILYARPGEPRALTSAQWARNGCSLTRNVLLFEHASVAVKLAATRLKRDCLFVLHARPALHVRVVCLLPLAFIICQPFPAVFQQGGLLWPLSLLASAGRAHQCV